MMMFRRYSDGDNVMDAIQSDIYLGLAEFGHRQADDWRFRVDVLVGRDRGPRGGTIIIRSRPGEPPRRETGRLQESIETAVETDAYVITLTVDSDVDYAAFLDGGTSRVAPRPHAPDIDEFIEQALDAIVAAIQG